MVKAKPNRPELLPLEHQAWRTLIEKRAGLDFGETRTTYLSRRLWERMQLQGIVNYLDYYNYVVFNPKGQSEWGELAEILVTGETSFFRHKPSFDVLTNYVLPELIRKKVADQPFNLWSAGCSTGEEPYSLAIALLEKVNPLVYPFKVWGTDISETVLAKARQGYYQPSVLRSTPSDYLKKYFLKIESREGAIYQISDTVKQLVQFTSFNFKELDRCLLKDQDIIFCQNVLIYFSADYRMTVVTELCQRLRPGGFLFLGPGEVVGLQVKGIQTVRLPDAIIYQRTEGI